MSAPMPARRLGHFTALVACRIRPTPRLSAVPLPLAGGCRNVSNPFGPTKKNKIDPDTLSNPILDDYLAQVEKERGRRVDVRPGGRPSSREGDLSTNESSLFLPEREIPGWNKRLTMQERRRLSRQVEQKKEQADQKRDFKLSELTLDPSPRTRRRLQRKLVIAGVKKFGRMTKAQKLMRTERKSLYKSHDLPSSWKKLQKVINQIAGKTIPDALVQLRFSKKKVARDVMKGLEIAQNEAIVARGMGLGGRSKRPNPTTKGTEISGVKAVQDLWSYQKFDKNNTAKASAKSAFRPKTIELKDGSTKVVRDPTEIYIDQAWIGKSRQSKSPEYRARGKVNLLTHRVTNFSVLLKEEKTRMRISDEIKKKRDKRKLWIPLPDRPITTQRQYCLW